MSNEIEITQNGAGVSEIAQPKSKSDVLWCIYIAGPDDLVAMPSKAIAEAVARKINADFADSKAKYGVTIKATAKRYTHGADSHQRNLAENYSDYAPMIEEPKA